MKILTPEDRLRRSAKLDDVLVGEMLEFTACKTLEDRLRICSPLIFPFDVFSQY